jgi:hypothetical protein|tara:strand:- start:179 stop:472 length:294 start_codon:yes stop_codon:yes gene_type:complete
VNDREFRDKVVSGISRIETKHDYFVDKVFEPFQKIVTKHITTSPNCPYTGGLRSRTSTTNNKEVNRIWGFMQGMGWLFATLILLATLTIAILSLVIK